jgi:hypothetical protein
MAIFNKKIAVIFILATILDLLRVLPLARPIEEWDTD